MSDAAVQGSPFNGSERPSKSYAKNRVCKDPECEVRLSMYNQGSYCYQHEPMAVPRTRGRKIPA